MANMFSVTKAERSRLRRLPFLPRFGIVIEVAGRRFSYKQAPMLETLLNLKDRGFSVGNLVSLAKEQLSEIAFPHERKAGVVKPIRPVVDQAAAQAAVERQGAEAKPAAEPKKKSPAKAAARKKSDKTDASPAT